MALQQARFIMTQGGVTSVNTLDVQYDENTLDPNSAADVLAQGWIDHMLDHLSDQTTLVETQIGDDTAGGTSILTASGTSANPAAGPQTGFNIRKLTQTGRSGRWFVMGIPEGALDESGKISSAGVNSVNASLALMLTDWTAGGVDAKVVSNLGAVNSISQLACSDYVCVQRRRLDRARGF